MDGFVAFARGDRSAAAEKYAESAEYLRAYSIDTTPEVFTECVRAFMRFRILSHPHGSDLPAVDMIVHLTHRP